MELVNKKETSEESTSANELMVKSASDSQIFRNNNFSNLTLTCTTYSSWNKSTTPAYHLLEY